MGLGKTLQVVALVHTLLTNSRLTKCKKVLILMPVNVINNWSSEIEKWTYKCREKISVHKLPDAKSNITEARLEALEDWFDLGGLFLMGCKYFFTFVFLKLN